MIVVTGATGQLGRLVIKELLQRIPASEIVAGVRDVTKAKDIADLGVLVRHADYDLPETLDAAFVGADKLLLISSSAVGQRVSQHRSVIEAAQRVNVRLIAYTSLLHADTSPLGLAKEHRKTEAMLKKSGIPFILLRNGWYSENYTTSLLTVLEHGAVLGSAGDGLIASASRADYAAAAAAILVSNDGAGRTYELAGDWAYTLSELAAEVARQSRKTVVYKNLPEAEYKSALIGFGLPEGLADLVANSDAGAAQGGLFDNGRQLSSLIGRATTPLESTIADALAS